MVQWDSLLQEKSTLRANPFHTFTFRTRTTEKNGNIDHTLLHRASPLTSDLLLLLLLFSLHLSSFDAKSAPSPPALTYTIDASDFHLPALSTSECLTHPVHLAAWLHQYYQSEVRTVSDLYPSCLPSASRPLSPPCA